MNIERILQMVARMFIGRAVNRGIRKGMKAMSEPRMPEGQGAGQGPKRKLTPEERAERQRRREVKQATRRARQATRMAGKMSRF
jgi:hypothetical protein